MGVQIIGRLCVSYFWSFKVAHFLIIMSVGGGNWFGIC